METTIFQVPLVIWLAGFLALYMAWGIGANDVANAMGTSVGSGALTSPRRHHRGRRPRILRRVPGRRPCHRHGAQGHARHGHGRPEPGSARLRHAGSARLGSHTPTDRLLLGPAHIDDALHRRRHHRLRDGGIRDRSGRMAQGPPDRGILGHLTAARGLLAFLIFRLIRYLILNRKNPTIQAKTYGPFFFFAVFFIIGPRDPLQGA